MINAHKEKYFDMYYQIANVAASQSVAVRAKVGACIVTKSGMIGIGFNGMPAGMDNECEYVHMPSTGFEDPHLKTKPEVIHAERNAIDKLTREGISTEDAIIFITMAPCIECAKSIATIGIKQVHYINDYKNSDGIDFLRKVGVDVYRK